MILAFCDKSYIVQIMLIVKTFFKIVCYLAPLIVIIISIIHIFKTVMSGKDDVLKDALKVTVKRIIAGLLIAFLPALINYVFTNLVNAKEVDFLACFESASKEKVQALKAKEKAEEEVKAKEEEKEDEAQLKKAWEAEQKQKGAKKQSFEEWKKKKEEEERKQRELEQQRMQQQQQQQGETSMPPGASGTISDVKIGENGVNVKQFHASNGVNMKYIEVLPTGSTSNLPLIIFLHGSGETNSVGGVSKLPIVSYVANDWDRSSKPFIFIAPVAPSSGWSGNKISAVKGLIDTVVSQYNVDTNHIIITGMSMGGYGTWNMLKTYGSFFSAGVPMSGCSSIDVSNFINVPIRAIVGGQEGETASCMKNVVNKLNNSGGNAIINVVQGASHGTIQKYYRNEELFKWMLSQ